MRRAMSSPTASKVGLITTKGAAAVPSLRSAGRCMTNMRKRHMHLGGLPGRSLARRAWSRSCRRPGA